MKDKTHLIPEGWKETTLGEAVNIIDGDRGSNYPKNNELLSNGFCLFLSTKNVPNTSFCFDEVKFINEKVHSKLRKGKLEKNDFVLTTRGTIGNFAYYSENTPYDHIRINSGMVVLRAKKELLENGFLEFFLKSGFFRKQVYSFSSGTAQPQLPIKDLRYIKILLPSLPEQKAIADVLSSFDNKIELLREQNKTLEAIAQTIFNEWFVHFNFPDENGKPYQATGGKMIVSELGPIPEGWRVGDIYDIVIVDYGYPFSSNQFNDKKVGLPLIRIRDLIDGEPEIYTDEICPDIYIVSSGDVLAGMDAEFRIVIWKGKKALLNQRLCRFRPKDNAGHTYAIEVIKPHLKFFEKTKFGTTVSHLNKRDLDSIDIIVPPNKLISAFSELTEPLYQKIILLNSQIQTLSNLRDELLTKLIKGDIRVEEANE